jgi:outer membrane immunogenic protein
MFSCLIIRVIGMRLTPLAVFFITNIVCTASYAADLVTQAPLAPEIGSAELRSSFSWNGAYAGANIGDSWSDGTGKYNGTTDKISANGFRAGAFAGYNYEIAPSIVAGLEADLGYDGTRTTTQSFGSLLTGGLETSVRGRLGYSYGSALIYLAGGYTGTSFNLKKGAFSANQWLNGWTVGAGADYAIFDNVFLRGEYRYSKYVEKDISFANVINKTEVSRQTLNIGVGVKF